MKSTLKELMFASKKLFYVFLAQVLALQLVSATGVGQHLENVPVHIELRDATLKEAFDTIAEETAFSFGFSRKVAKRTHRYTVTGASNLHELLEHLGQQARLSFRRINGKIIVIEEPKGRDENVGKIILFQTEPVTGKVLDASSNEPLIGATVQVKNTTIGTVTDRDGEFRLEVPEEAATLVISYVGFVSQEVAIGTGEVLVTLEVDTEALNEVVVTSFRGQNLKIIDKKRNTPQIAEFLTQDNIGRLPDFAAADAARRMPGVNAVFEEDEATKIAIRGLDPIYTNSSIDGLFIPGAERRSRVVNFESIPSTVISTIEAYKSRTANLDGNGIAGNFNLRTRSAFEGEYLAGRFTVGRYTFEDVPRSESFRNDALKNGPSIRTDVTYATTFGPGGKLGIVASGSYNRKDRDQFTFPKNAFTTLGGDITKPVPNRVYGAIYDNVVDRYGGFLKLEYKPNQDFYFSVAGHYYRKTDDEVRYENRIRSLQFDTASVTTSSGRFTAAENRAVYDNFFYDRRLRNLMFNSYLNVGDRGKLTMRGALADTESTIGSYWGEFRTPVSEELSGRYTFSDDDFELTLDNPDFFTDPTNYIGTGRPGGRKVKDLEESWVLDLSYAWNMDGSARGWGFQLGAQSRNLVHDYRRTDMRVDYTGEDISWSDFPLPNYEAPDYINVPLITYDTEAFERHIAANSSTERYDPDAIGYEQNRALIPNPRRSVRNR